MTNYLVESNTLPLLYHSLIRIGNYYFCFYRGNPPSYDTSHYETSVDLQTWSNKTLVSNDAVGSDIVFWKNKIWIAYWSNFSDRIFVMSGTVSGTSISWDVPVQINFVITGGAAAIFAVSNDESVLYMITRGWKPFPERYRVKVFKTTNGTNWTEILNYDDGTDYAPDIEICQHPIDDDGCMAFMDRYSGGGVWAKWRSNLYDGNNWAGWVDVGDATALANYSWGKARKYGNMIIFIFCEARLPTYTIYWQKYEDGTWMDFKQILSEPIIGLADTQALFGLCLGPYGEYLYAVYQEDTNDKLYLRKWDGSSWTSKEEVEQLTDDSGLIALIRESDDMENILPVSYAEASAPWDTRVCYFETSETISGSIIGIKIKDCQIYSYLTITGSANDILGEEIVGEGLYWEKKTPAS